MIEYVAIYIKILEDKDKEISINGPFIGPSSHDKNKVEEELRILVKSSQAPIVPKIYECEPGNYQDAMIEARLYFDNLSKQIRNTHNIIQEDVNMHKRRSTKKRKK